MVVKQGLKGSNQTSNSTRHQSLSSDNASSQPRYGRVFAVVTGENTPTPEMYLKANKRIGTVFYKDYQASKNLIGSSIDNNILNGCSMARPFSANIQYYPLLNEVIEITTAPSPLSQITTDTSGNTTYWTQIVNLWGDSQQNSNSPDSISPLGKTFVDTDNKNILSYEGDHILLGRNSNSIRFGSTVGLYSNPSKPNYNEWSSVGINGSPILILSNGQDYNSTPSNLYVEKINQDSSSIYLTSTQALPIEVDRTDITTPISSPIAVDKYSDSQVTINGNRLLFNSKKDEILLFAKTDIGLNTNNNINLNAKNNIYLNSDNIYLGSTSDNNLPKEPVLLGLQTMNLFADMVSALSSFASAASTSVAIDSTGQSAPIAQLKVACDALSSALDNMYNQLDPGDKNYIASDKIFIS